MTNEVTIGIANDMDQLALNSLMQENAELKQELYRLSMVVEDTKTGYWDWDIRSGNITINNAWAEMIGYTPEELGQINPAKWETLCHPDDLAFVAMQLERNFLGETDDYEAEIRIRHKNGHWVWILDRGRVFERDQENNVLRMTGSHQDITEQKHAEERHRKEQNLFLEGPVTIFRWLNTQGYPTEYVSPNVTRLMGYTPSSFTSQVIGYADIIHPDDLDRILDEIAACFADPERTSFEQEYRVVRNDGKIIWIYDFTTIIRDEEGNIISFEGYVFDNTLRKQSESEAACNRRFEHLIATLASQFINVLPDRIDAMIDKSLQAIGEFVQADRSYIFQYYDNMRLMDKTHEWCAEGIGPQIAMLQQLTSDQFGWSTNQITAGKKIIVPKVSELPDEAAAEQKILEQQDIKSFILIPLVSENQPFGYIGFDAVRAERDWPSNAASILSLAGGIIANALQRQKFRKMLQAELDLALKLSASQSLEETMQHSFETVLEISGMDSGAVYLVDENESGLNLFQSRGISDAVVSEVRTFTGDTPEYLMISSGKVFYSDQLPPVSDRFHHAMVEKEGLKSFAILPVISKNRVIACFAVGSHTLYQVPEFARNALETVASHIGAAIMQARHEERVSAVSRNLESLFESIDDMLIILAESGTIVHANPATAEVLGYTLDELRKMNIFDVHPPEKHEKSKKYFERILAGIQNSCDITFLTKSGETIPVETKITHGTWDSRPVIFCASRDISERLKSQSALIESEQKFRELTEYLPFPLFETDLRGMVSYINHSGMEFFDISPEEVRKEVSAFSFCWPENLELAVANQQKIFDPGYIPHGNEYIIVMKDGRRLPLLLFNTPIRTEGKLAGMRTTVIDLSELKRAEAALRESSLQKRVGEEFRSIIENIPGLVYRVTEENTIRFFSDPKEDWARHVLLPDHSGQLGTILAFIHPDDRQVVFDMCSELHSKPTWLVTVFRVSLPRQEIRWFENRSTSIFTDEGRFSAIDGILFDITDRIKTQEAKKQLEESLIKTQRRETIGTLAGGIAHDFNNILSPILGYAEMGMINLPEDNLLRDYFTNIILAAERAQNLVSQILTYSRAEETSPVTLRIQDVIEEAMKLLRPTIPSFISINTVYEKCGNVHADPSQIHQVIMNLCTNAFHAISESGGEITIDLREVMPDTLFSSRHPSLKAARYIQLSVSDTGHGMDEKTMEKIFEPFFTTKPVNRGTGLGLSVVHGIITSIDGDITIESTPGKGSTFRIYLPVTNEDSPFQDSDNMPAEKLPGTRVLFVDDELAAIQVIHVMMEHLGFNLKAMNSPVEALAEFRKNPEAFDLVITDLAMPKMTGIELARNIHELNPRIPLILMTGYGKDIENASSLCRYGLRKVVKKPVRLARLAQAIKEVITGEPLQ